MFLQDFLRANPNIMRISKNNGTFSQAYDFWSNNLLERAMHLFIYEGLPTDIPKYEIDLILLTNGTSFYTDKYKKIPSVFSGHMTGNPTQYYDIKESYAVNSPVYSEVLKIGKDGIMLRNNSLRTSILPLIHRYATLLAHCEITLVWTLINGRDASGIPIASTEDQIRAIENYRNTLFNGKIGSILDPAFSGVKFISAPTNTAISVKDLFELRRDLLYGYYNDIGIKTNNPKKGNMIEAEATSNDVMVLFNLSDMLECRKEDFDKVNELYGLNITVSLNEELIGEIENGTEDNDDGSLDLSEETE